MSVAEKFADCISGILGLCGHGKQNNWSVRVADYFFIDCGCCWFWRGVLFGTVFTSGMFAIMFSIALLLKRF